MTGAESGYQPIAAKTTFDRGDESSMSHRTVIYLLFLAMVLYPIHVVSVLVYMELILYAPYQFYSIWNRYMQYCIKPVQTQYRFRTGTDIFCMEPVLYQFRTDTFSFCMVLYSFLQIHGVSVSVPYRYILYSSL